MALTPEQIEEIATDWFSEEWAVAWAIKLIEQVEAEVRKDYESLIRQMLEALTAPVDGDALHALHMSAIASARARLEKAP